MSQLLAEKVALVFGVANRFSIAWAIAQALHRAGARLVLSYQGERVERNVRQLAASLPGTLTLPCEVSDDAQLDALFATPHARAWRPRLPGPRHRLRAQPRP
ncbi:MAG: hypothetical protein KatS3mg061_3428 [Dehalococcoidia bacterium]|nr:MAG: hypothetical protein KatS3mg061_3428 [Dehalococcoidia bacterium]